MKSNNTTNVLSEALSTKTKQVIIATTTDITNAGTSLFIDAP